MSSKQYLNCELSLILAVVDVAFNASVDVTVAFVAGSVVVVIVVVEFLFIHKT